MKAFVYYLHTVRRVEKREEIEKGEKYLLLHLRKCDILEVECGQKTWKRGDGGVRGGSFHFLAEESRVIFCKIIIFKFSLLLEIDMIIFFFFSFLFSALFNFLGYNYLFLFPFSLLLSTNFTNLNYNFNFCNIPKQSLTSSSSSFFISIFM